MKELSASASRSRLFSTIANSVAGGVLGGSVAALLVIGFTEVLKLMLGVVSKQGTWVLVIVPLIGLALSVLVLYGFGSSAATQTLERKRAGLWRTFPPRAARSDLTGDMVAFAGEEDRFPWRLA